MGDHRAQRSGQGATPSRGSIVLTPPGGIPIAFDPSVLDTAAVSVAGGTPVVETAPELAASPCVGGHDSDAHRHWRPGSDCGTCGSEACTTYHPRGGALRRLLRGLGMVH